MTTQPVLMATSRAKRRWWHGRFWRILFMVIIVWLGGTAVYLLFLWPWMRTWGATKAEINT